jgi:hypothetical protein
MSSFPKDPQPGGVRSTESICERLLLRATARESRLESDADGDFLNSFGLIPKILSVFLDV